VLHDHRLLLDIEPGELPLGAVTALIGVPFFLIKLRRLV